MARSSHEVWIHRRILEKSCFICVKLRFIFNRGDLDSCFDSSVESFGWSVAGCFAIVFPVAQARGHVALERHAKGGLVDRRVRETSTP